MRHKYETRGFVLARMAAGEANTRLALLTHDLGLVWARAQGLRRTGGKLASSLVTFAEADIVLVRGKDGWRVTGAVLVENWFVRLTDPDARRSAARVAGLALRLSPNETPDTNLLPVMRDFFCALSLVLPSEREGAELVAASYVLASLGLNEDEGTAGSISFAPENLLRVLGNRDQYVARINRGIAASGL